MQANRAKLGLAEFGFYATINKSYQKKWGNKMEFHTKTFGELTNSELYAILKLRIAVFCVEQDCVYQDCDDYDQQAIHIFLTDGDEVAGYLRILKRNTKFKEVSIGRVITNPAYRGKGVGKQCMQKAISYIQTEWKEDRIRISAQKYAKGFYENVGFRQDSEEYLEDGIAHIEMIHEGKSQRRTAYCGGRSVCSPSHR